MTDSFSRHKINPGWIEVIVGCMFSGKTEELIKQLHRAQYARRSLHDFKPLIDNRYSENDVASHKQTTFPSEPVKDSVEILRQVKRTTDIVGIDEAQFFDDGLIDVVESLANAGKRVIVAGLDTDWRGEPFGCMPQIMAKAEVIHKQYAICVVCGEPATRTQRLVSNNSEILVGSTESYEARCRQHFDPELSLRLGALETSKDLPTSP